MISSLERQKKLHSTFISRGMFFLFSQFKTLTERKHLRQYTRFLCLDLKHDIVFEDGKSFAFYIVHINNLFIVSIEDI